MPLLKSVAAGLVALSFGAMATRAQDATDTIMRASYCVGVLKESVKQMERHGTEAAARQANCPRYGIELPATAVPKGYSSHSIAQCQEDEALVRAFAETLSKDLEARRLRYARYLALRILDMSPNQRAASMALVTKGEHDAAEKQREPTNPGVANCLKANQPSVAALIECVAGFDQVEANITRCRSAPDGLPF